jgi:N4-gp56 family major capsid protein
VADVIVAGQPVGTGGVAQTTNFDRTVTALVSSTIQENLRKVVRYMGSDGYVTGSIVPGTNLIRFISYGDLSIPAPLPAPPAPGTVPWLVEGKRPDLEPISIGYEEISAYQAGRLVGISDVALEYNPHNLFAIAAERVAFNAMATLDQYVASILHAGTNIQYASTAAATNQITAAMKLTAAEIREAVATLKAANVPTFADGYYHAFIHPNMVFDVMGDTAVGGWIEAAKYGAVDQLFAGEIGRLYGVRFIETPVGTYLGTIGATSAKVYSTFVFGPGAWALGDVQTIRSYMVRPGGDHTDPLAQLAEVGWKGMFGAKLLTNVGPKYVIIQSGGTL